MGENPVRPLIPQEDQGRTGNVWAACFCRDDRGSESIGLESDESDESSVGLESDESDESSAPPAGEGASAGEACAVQVQAREHVLCFLFAPFFFVF